MNAVQLVCLILAVALFGFSVYSLIKRIRERIKLSKAKKEPVDKDKEKEEKADR